MPSPVLDALAAQVTATEGVIDSAIALINGIAARVQTAVDAALANGATAAELQPVTDEIVASVRHRAPIHRRIRRCRRRQSVTGRSIPKGRGRCPLLSPRVPRWPIQYRRLHRSRFSRTFNG